MYRSGVTMQLHARKCLVVLHCVWQVNIPDRLCKMHQRCFKCNRSNQSTPVSAWHAPAAGFPIQPLPARCRYSRHSSAQQQHAQYAQILNSVRHQPMCHATNNQDTEMGCQPNHVSHIGVLECISIATGLSLCIADASLAMEQGLSYNPTGGEEFFKNLAGVAYIILVAVFLYRVFTRRAKRAREEKVTALGVQPGQELPPSIFEQLRVRLNKGSEATTRQAGPLDAFLGAAQAGLLAAGLYIFTSKLQGSLDATELPDAYTARNISITVRTILLGISWLATFVFAANSIGLLGLSFQWLLFPDSIKEDEEEIARKRALQEAAGPQLPKVSVSSKPDELRLAFNQAERLGKKEGEAAATAIANKGNDELSTPVTASKAIDGPVTPSNTTQVQ